MIVDFGTAAEGIGGAVTAVAGLYGAIKHLAGRYKRTKEKYREGILKEAKEGAERIREELEAKITKVESELRSQQEMLAVDLSHTKDIYNSEIKILGQRIQELRQDISAQHANLVALLTKLVDSR